MTSTTLALGLALALIVAAVACRARALSRSGAIGALLVGTLTFGLGGLIPAVLLLLFFLSSSALSRLAPSRKARFKAAFSKSGRRDLGQVLANGGLAALLAALFGLSGSDLWLAGVAGALAAANADTWSTELGVLARRRPRLITTGARVPAGTSGGVTPEGTLAALAGSALIAAAAGSLGGSWALVWAVAPAGLLGALVDSLLGATLQAIYRCPVCEKETERHPLHTCGAETGLSRGLPWVGNDLVNFLAAVVGAVLSMALWAALAAG